MSDGNGDGEGYVTRGEFRGYVATTNSALEKVNMALWGGEGTTGIVGDIRELKTRGKMGDRIITLILGIVCSVVTALIIGGM